MRNIFKSMLILFTFCVIITAQVSAQTVKGKVLDVQGDPIIGATVMEKGTHNGTITDAKGLFTLKTSLLKGILEVRYLGYQPKEVQITGDNYLTIRLQEENSTLNEVVVVGYGTEKKISLTGSVSTVKSGDILRAPLPTI
jgi:hypothetical protein